MVKEKRKGRLDKGQSGEFIGFGAFADTTTTTSISTPSIASAASAINPTTSTPQTSLTSGPVSTSALSPIYLGSDPSLNVLFTRIGQKRDATTKGKALTDLVTYLNDTTQPKRNQVEALPHFLYLYQTKLQYDDTPRIRALSVQACLAAITRLPKAWRSMVVGGDNGSETDLGSGGSSSSNSSNNSNVEILGALLCARADPASEVRVAAQTVLPTILNGDASSLPACYRGMWKYVERILSYGKPITMLEELFSRGKGSSGDGGNADPSASLSDRQREGLEERFERIVGTALEGLQLLLQEPSIVSLVVPRDHGGVTPSQGNTSPNTDGMTTPDNVKFLWKTLSSNKPPLRRKTYGLMSTICQKLPFLIDTEKTSRLLLQALSSEKEPSNVGPLLETLLAFVASIPKAETSGPDPVHKSRRDTMAQYAKALSRLFQRGCLGASASQWAPMVLPIVALMPSEGVTAPQVGTLTSVWEGRTNVVGVADSLQVVQAVAETAAFLSVQQSPQELDEVTAMCWIKCLDAYLTVDSTLVGPSLLIHNGTLKTTLANGWVQLDNASRNKPQSSINTLREWFWNEHVQNILVSANTVMRHQHLTNLLKEIKKVERVTVEETVGGASTVKTMYSPLLARKFQSILVSPRTPSEASQSTNSDLPTTDVYELGIAILQLVPGQLIFEDETSQNKFVTNQILQWTILHTSSGSIHVNSQLALFDIEMFHCLCWGRGEGAVGVAAKQLWETLLREVIMAKPDLRILLDCLASLCEKGWTAVDLGTESLDDLCIQIARMAIPDAIEAASSNHHHHDDSESEISEIVPNEEYANEAQFLQGCVGLGRTIRQPLVGATVIEAWVESACPEDTSVDISANPVLDTLVAMIENQKLLSHPHVLDIVTQSWRQGGRLWNDRVVSWLLDANQQHNMYVSLLADRASKELKEWLDELILSSEYDDNRAWIWVERSCRLFDLCQEINSADSAIPSPSLTAVGLGNISLWEQGPNLYLSHCLLRLIRYLEQSRRWRAITDSNEDSMKLLVAILVNLSGGAPDLLEADFARRRKDLCAVFLTELKFPELDKDVIFGACMTCVDTLSYCLKEAGRKQTNKTCKIIAVLSQLVSLRFQSLTPTATIDSSIGKLRGADIHVGDKLSYIKKEENPSEMELCTVIKVHKDLPEELYFTIRLDRNGSFHERQTVVDRLRKTDSCSNEKFQNSHEDGLTPIDQVDEEEKAQRDRLVAKIVGEVVAPTVDVWPDIAFEIYSVLITQCGLLSERGIGSIHYSVLQKMLGIQQGSQALLASPNPSNEELASSFWRLALALGYGVNVPSSRWGIPLLGLNATDSILYILNYLNDADKVTNAEIDCAFTAWLTLCAPNCGDVEIRQRSFSTLFHMAARLFEEENGFGRCHTIALRAIQVGQLESHKTKQGESSLQDSEAEALTELVKAFASTWKEGVSVSVQDSMAEPAEVAGWQSLSAFKSVFHASITERPQFVAIASRQCLDELTRCLYSPSKRWYAMQILETYSSSGQALHDIDEAGDIINPKSINRLEQWTKDLLEEEAEDLENDMATVAQWLSPQQMNELESWHDDDNIDDNKACGRMLIWLDALQIFDTASGKESTNRPAVTSYVARCETVNAMLDLALIYGNVGTERKAKFETVAPLDAILKKHSNHDDPEREDSLSLDLSLLASLVVFRTIELFPTLAKNWWEISCPTYMTQTIRDFVETQVSPEILKQAIESIKNAAAFGEMQVKGSSLSREVTATYVQDDFTLSVVVKLPLSFPFRRAEVDCSKTLGVPESRWKRWSLQITQMLNNQGGTLKDALLLWKENVDKEFEGIEPCPVCYSVLHVKSHKLPNMECKTCHNCFHSDCLFEWFKSSGKSACVLCQQPWSGIRV